MIEARLITRPQPFLSIPGAKAFAEERALEVRIDHAVPVGFRQLIERAADVRAGVVDQDVDVTAHGRDVGVQAFDVGAARHVGTEREYAAPCRGGDLLCGDLAALTRSPGER